MSLEIRVFEQVNVVDTIGDAIRIIKDAIRKWFSSGDQNPLKIEVSKVNSRGPPALGVDVGESVRIKDRLV